MSGITKIFKRGHNLTINDIMGVYNSINKERFDGMLHYKPYTDGAISILTSSVRDGITIDIHSKFTEYTYSGDKTESEDFLYNHIDMFDNYDDEFYIWLTDLFIQEFVKRLEGDIYLVGYGIQDISYYKDLSFRDYLKDKYNNENEIEMKMKTLEHLEGIWGSEFYHRFITEKVPRRNDKIDSILNI